MTVAGVATLCATKYGATSSILLIVGIIFVIFAKRQRRVFAFIVLLTGISLLWTAAVHEIVRESICTRCRVSVISREIQVLGAVCSSTNYQEENIVSMISADLGYPCCHESLLGLRKQDYHGLLIRRSYGHNGISGLIEDLTWYDHSVSSFVQALAENNPELGKEFRDSLQPNGDVKFRRNLIQKVYNYGTSLEKGVESAL